MREFPRRKEAAIEFGKRESGLTECTVIGVGGAGLSLARHAHELVGGRFVAINTDRKRLEELEPERGLVIGPLACRGMSAASPVRGREAADESLCDISAQLPTSGKVVFMAGLGGGTGTGALPPIVRAAIQQGLEPLVAVTLPFQIETERREAALSGLKELEGTGATVITHDHAKQLTDSIGLEEALMNSAEVLARRIKLWTKGESDAQ